MFVDPLHRYSNEAEIPSQDIDDDFKFKLTLWFIQEYLVIVNHQVALITNISIIRAVLSGHNLSPRSGPLLQPFNPEALNFVYGSFGRPKFFFNSKSW